MRREGTVAGPAGSAAAPGELLARYSYLEPLIAGRKVLELGAARATAGASARALVARGAAEVLALEEAGGLGEAGGAAPEPGLRFAELTLAELPPAAFDLVLASDGPALVADAERLARLAALLAPRGQLVAALPAAGGLGLAALAGEAPPQDVPSYASFVGALSAHFEAVEVVTQSAVAGWLLGPVAPAEAPELGVDGAHGGAPEAAFYLAVCSREGAGLAGMTLVTLPFAPLAEATLALAEAARAGGAARASLDAARGEAEAALEALAREGAARAEAEAELVQARAGLTAALRRAEAAVERVADLEASLDEAKVALDEAREALQAARDLAESDARAGTDVQADADVAASRTDGQAGAEVAGAGAHAQAEAGGGGAHVPAPAGAGEVAP